MFERPADLPDYKYPPLVEVVLSVQFAELQAYRTVHAGLLWEDRFRKAYPIVAEQPPLEPVFETFGAQETALPFQLKQISGPQVPRLWFMNEQKTELVQIQADKFIHNWRKVGDDEHYPRYERLRDRFFTELNELEGFFKKWQIGTIQPNQCEITYVNRLELKGYDLRAQPSRAMKFLRQGNLQPSHERARLPEMEDCNLVGRYVLKDAVGERRGRLVVTAQAWPKEPVLRLDLTVRGAPTKADLEAVADFLDEGRRTIVHAFTAITTKQMHEIWGRLK